MILWFIGVLLSWCAGWLVFGRGTFIPKDGVPAAKAKRLSIVIPARNEANNLPRLFQSLQQQNCTIHEVILVDDGSTDQTQTIARRYGTIVLSTPADGPGKAAACWQGGQAATGDLLLFLDADTAFLSKDGLSRLLEAFGTKGTEGLLSVQPYHYVEKTYEQLSYVFNVVIMAGLNRFSILGEKIQAGGAFGPCLLCTKRAYMQVNGHQDMALGILDDIALAQRFISASLPIHLYGGRDFLMFRMYPQGVKQLMQGWSKDFATAARVTNGWLMVGIIGWIIGNCMVIFSGLIYPWPIAVAIYACYYGQNVFFAKRVGSFHAVSLLLFPSYFLFFLLLFAWSAIQTHIRKKVTWKGRKIDL